MTANLHVLKSILVGMAAEGRHLRHTARKLGRHHQALRSQADATGVSVREHLWAYALLRGKRLEDCEASTTRTVAKKATVLKLVNMFFTYRRKTEDESWADYFSSREREKTSFIEQATADLDAWTAACVARAEALEAARLEKLEAA